eukprot:8140787-Alexandrium_andersonii.AAC.1
MARRQDAYTGTEQGIHADDGPAQDRAATGSPRTPADTDHDVLAERGRKGRDPTYAPKFHGCRLVDMQDVLL